MNEKLRAEVPSRQALDTITASDLMTPSPVSLRWNATVREAVVLLTDRGISSAAVIDDRGRVVGVLSHADIVVHDRESGCEGGVPDYYSGQRSPDANSAQVSPNGIYVEPDPIRVQDIMTPVVFSVAPDTPARRVVEGMVELKVHRLFVVDSEGVLTGVISALDVLKLLSPEQPPARSQ